MNRYLTNSARREEAMKIPMERPLWYVLDGAGNPVPSTDPAQVERMMADRRRIVQQDTLTNLVGDRIFVSTVFLGLDHNFSGVGAPVLFETLMEGETELNMERYTTRAVAKRGHDLHVEFAKKMLVALAINRLSLGLLCPEWRRKYKGER